MNTLKTTVRSLHRVMRIGALMLPLSACNKVDNFYNKLQALPQIDNSLNYIYNDTYLVGDTMVITGRLQPQNNLQITIGSVAAQLIKTDSVLNGNDYNDRVSLLITEPMVGKNREVNITSGGYSTRGNPVNVYPIDGAGSLGYPLKAVPLASFSGMTMFHYRSDKGDAYFYSSGAKGIAYMDKTGAAEVVYPLSGNLPLLDGEAVSSFLAGGADPQGRYLYFSVKTQSAYWLIKVDMASAAKEAQVLNRSAGLSAPFEGNIATVQAIVSGIYPDAAGNLYLGLGLGARNAGFQSPLAIATYTAQSGTLRYLYKTGNAAMPGRFLRFLACWFSPDEHLLYTFNAESGLNRSYIDVYDLNSLTRISSLILPNNGNPYKGLIGDFSHLQADIGYLWPSFNECFGFLPLPGMRLLALMYFNVDAAPADFPKWVVFDFNEQRSYLYAPGKFIVGSSLSVLTAPVRDQLLNTDEDGNIMMTSRAGTYIIKTEKQ